MERERHISAAPVPEFYGSLILSVTDIEPECRTTDKDNKHDGNDSLCVHSLVLLLLFSTLKANNAENACTDKGYRRKAYPQGRIEVIACFRCVAKLVVHLNNRGCSDLNRCLLVGRENIACGSIVADLRNGVLANTQAINEDFAVFVSLKGLVIVRTCYSKREALQFSIRGSLNDFQRAFLCGVDKANACLVLYGIGLAAS